MTLTPARLAVLRAIAIHEEDRSAHAERYTLQAIADGLKACGQGLSAETADSLIRRLPERLRPYVQTVYRG
jgi:hypothetical protein